MPDYYYERSEVLRMLDSEGRAELARRAPSSLVVAIADAFSILDEQRKSRLATI